MGASEPLEELITLPQLKKLKDIFEKDEHGTFTTDQFVRALRHVMPNVPEAQVREWFGRIDLTGLGVLNWGEFSGYLVQRNHHKVVQEESRFEFQKQETKDSAKNVDDHHRDMITCTLAHPVTGKVYTCGRDGIVKQWHQATLQHERILHNAGTWITAASFFRQNTRLMVSSIDRQLNVFDVTTGNLVTTYAGRKHASERKEIHRRKPLHDTSKYGIKVDFPRQPHITVDSNTTLEDFASQMRRNMTGQERGSFEVAITPLCDLSSPPMAHCCLEEGGRETVALGLQDGALQMYPLEPNPDSGLCVPSLRTQLHSDVVSKIDYSPSLAGFISSSWDKTLKVYSVEREKAIQTFGGDDAPWGHQKAVFNFDWSKELSSAIIASVGSERRVYVWEPRVVRPVFKIDGHQQPLVNVALNHANHQLITLSQDKCIKVWDVRTYRCIQAITDTANYHPDNYISSLCYDHARERVITSATCPTLWTASKVSTQPGSTAYSGHTMPIVEALYNQKLKQLLSADRHQIVLWDMDTGERLFHCRLSKQLPQDHQRLGQMVAKATADQRGTRLVTGTEKGSVVMWNLQNCQVCAVGENPDDAKECTALLHCQRKERWYVVAALGPTLHIFEDSDDVHQMRMVGRCTTHAYASHPAAPPVIASIVLVNQSMLALGLDDGRVLLYTPDINRFCGVLLNPHNSAVERLHLPAPNTLLSAQTDGTLTFFDLRTRSPVLSISSLQGMDGTLSAMTVSSDHQHVVVGDSEGAVRIWRMAFSAAAADAAASPGTFATPSPPAASNITPGTAATRMGAVSFAGFSDLTSPPGPGPGEGAAASVSSVQQTPAIETAAHPVPSDPGVTPPRAAARRFSEGPLLPTPPAGSVAGDEDEDDDDDAWAALAADPSDTPAPATGQRARPDQAAGIHHNIPPLTASDRSVVLTHKCTFKAHTDTVTSIVNVELRPPVSLLVTGALDCQVKAFTFRGVHVGTFGGGAWNMYDNNTWAMQPTALTAKRVDMSSTSTAFFSSLLKGINTSTDGASPRGARSPTSAQQPSTPGSQSPSRVGSIAREEGNAYGAAPGPSSSSCPKEAGGGKLAMEKEPLKYQVALPSPCGPVTPRPATVGAVALRERTPSCSPERGGLSGFLIPCPPTRAEASLFEEITPPVGVSPGRHILRRNRRKCPLVKRRRLKCIPMVVGAVCLLAVEAVLRAWRRGSVPAIPPLQGAGPPATFLTECGGWDAVGVGRAGGVGVSIAGSLTARDMRDSDAAALRQRVEQRWLARHGQVLTARGDAKEFIRLDRGAEVLRQLRRRKVKQVEEATDPLRWGKSAALIKTIDVQPDVPPPKIPNPRPPRKKDRDAARQRQQQPPPAAAASAAAPRASRTGSLFDLSQRSNSATREDAGGDDHPGHGAAMAGRKQSYMQPTRGRHHPG